MRINKFVAAATGVSRREADELVASGEVNVNGVPVALGYAVSETDRVTLAGKPLQLQNQLYILLNKPVGYVCSRKRQDEKPTIYELLPDMYQNLKTAGRLDADSSGLVLLTNDGDFAQQLTHPKYRKEKRYDVVLNRPLTAEHRDSIEKGIGLDDGVSKLFISGDNPLSVTMFEGRNRQIRRTFAALGLTVEQLHRTKFGEYEIEDLSNNVYASADRKPAVNSQLPKEITDE